MSDGRNSVLTMDGSLSPGGRASIPENPSVVPALPELDIGGPGLEQNQKEELGEQDDGGVGKHSREELEEATEKAQRIVGEVKSDARLQGYDMNMMKELPKYPGQLHYSADSVLTCEWTRAEEFVLSAFGIKSIIGTMWILTQTGAVSAVTLSLIKNALGLSFKQ